MRKCKVVMVCAMAGVLIGATSSWATPTSGELFYTTFAGTDRVFKVDYSFDGSTFSLGASTTLASNIGADGIAGNPQDANSLFVGAQGPTVHRVSRTGAGVISSHPTGGPSAFHLEVPDNDTLLASGIPGALARFPVLAGGSLGAASSIPLLGDNTTLTQVITTPGGDFYTSSGPAGNGSYGTLTYDTGMASTATSATTAQFYGASGSLGGVLPAAHGGVYDPFSDSVLIFGSDHITQLSLAGAILADITVADQDFDQGTVDGMGHVFVADNGGELTFLDYSAASAGGLIDGAGTFISTQFLAAALDDVAPLIGSGGTNNPGPAIPEPLSATLGVMGLSLLGMRLRRQVA